MNVAGEVRGEIRDHYNGRQNEPISKRDLSRVVAMKSFNNWVKSMVIQYGLAKLQCSPHKVNVLDIACGKGGDIPKWKSSRIKHLVGIDIAGDSVKHAMERYKERVAGRKGGFSAEWYACDCFKDDINLLIKAPQIDLVSCQFAFHYCFESEIRARKFFENIAGKLRKGGTFIMTLPDCYAIAKSLAQLQQQGKPPVIENEFVKFAFDAPPSYEKCFGIKYRFSLEDSVEDVPEFLVIPQLLYRLAGQYGFEIVKFSNFHAFYYQLMNAEPAKREEHVKLLSKIMNGKELSRAEWMVSLYYAVAVFRKTGNVNIREIQYRDYLTADDEYRKFEWLRKFDSYQDTPFALADLEVAKRPLEKAVEEPIVKKRKVAPSLLSSEKDRGDGMIAALGILQNVGFEMGKGLREGGISAPIEVEEKMGRGGLGFAESHPVLVTPAERSAVDLNEPVPIQQSVSFYEVSPKQPVLTLAKVPFNAPRDYRRYSDGELVKQMMETKSKFDLVGHMEFIEARRRANPYEKIGSSIFINRAAVKMANINKLYGGICRYDYYVKEGRRKMYFSDVCAGPGGFTEYILWLNQGHPVEGIGFTLKSAEDFRIRKFRPDARPPFKDGRKFTPYYGVHNDGDVTKNENLTSYAAKVRQDTGGHGVDLFTADGGFSVQGSENYQEEHLKQLVLCQFIAGLSVMAVGGTFVCKIFDTLTPFTAGLLYLLGLSFEAMSLVKPYTSRPANSEKYVVCLRFRGVSKAVLDHLYMVNAWLSQYSRSRGEDVMLDMTKPDDDIRDIVVADTIPAPFVDYLRSTNNACTRNVIKAAQRLLIYLADDYLVSQDQERIKRDCLAEWDLPIEDAALHRKQWKH